ncbi:hypothetical protein [Malonomonas rubra]|nr:hypothetical protein [Malonomonas rubra]
MSGGKASLDSGEFLFRFRSAEALLGDDFENGGFQELEKQTIYFARPESLNDPMEGLSDTFWDGDQVLWENLFRHYALSLIWYCGTWLILEPHKIGQAKVSAWLTEKDLPTSSFRALYRDFCSAFCAEIESTELAGLLASQSVPLRRERFTALLFHVHQAALSQLFRLLKENNLSKFELPIERHCENTAKAMVSCWGEIPFRPPAVDIPVEDYLEDMASIGNRVSRQLELGMLTRSDNIAWAQKTIALIVRFPEMYVDAFLQDLHFAPWRVACFSRNCVNASMWGTYGSEHRGAALIFRTKQRGDKRFFRVNGMTGTGAQGIELDVHSIKYRKQPPPLDCFLEMGMLPMGKLVDTWMKSVSGATSVRLREVTDDIESWRTKHWRNGLERATWKHTDWKHEDEQRLIASTALTNDPAPEPLNYNFSQLEGIVFGMRMSSEDKMRISNLIEKKCRAEGRRDFRFFQAYYSPSKGEMCLAELGLLKFGIAD